MCVILTVHLVALNEGFIFLEVGTRVPDVGPDVVIKVPGILKPYQQTSLMCPARYCLCTNAACKIQLLLLPALVFIKDQEKQRKFFDFFLHPKSPGSSWEILSQYCAYNNVKLYSVVGEMLRPGCGKHSPAPAAATDHQRANQTAV